MSDPRTAKDQKRLPLMKTAYRIKKTGHKDGGGKKPKKKTIYANVHCDKHGSTPADNRLFKSVSVGLPKTKAEKYSGCPLCAQEVRVAARLAAK